MRFRKPLLLLVLCLIAGEIAYAQRRKSNSGKSHFTRRYHNYKAPTVRGQKAKLICPVFQNSEYPYHGFGFKLGDPFGLTYKYYASKRFSIALDFGKPSSGLYSRYFREKFYEDADEYDTLREDAVITYSSHKVRSDLVGEIKFLYSIEADKISPGLQVYVGGGWEWKSTKLRYSYSYDLETNEDGQLINYFLHVDRNRVTMGPQLVLGIEYAYFQLPVSAFMEVEFFTDIQADPGWQRFEGGVGLRYIF